MNARIAQTTACDVHALGVEVVAAMVGDSRYRSARASFCELQRSGAVIKRDINGRHSPAGESGSGRLGKLYTFRVIECQFQSQHTGVRCYII